MGMPWCRRSVQHEVYKALERRALRTSDASQCLVRIHAKLPASPLHLPACSLQGLLRLVPPLLLRTLFEDLRPDASALQYEAMAAAGVGAPASRLARAADAALGVKASVQVGKGGEGTLCFEGWNSICRKVGPPILHHFGSVTCAFTPQHRRTSPSGTRGPLCCCCSWRAVLRMRPRCARWAASASSLPCCPRRMPACGTTPPCLCCASSC